MEEMTGKYPSVWAGAEIKMLDNNGKTLKEEITDGFFLNSAVILEG